MSYEAYKGYRLAPDDNGCVDVLTGSYEQVGTYPSTAAAKRAVDHMNGAPLGGMRFEIKVIASTWDRTWTTTPVDESPELIDYYFKKFAAEAKRELAQRNVADRKPSKTGKNAKESL